MIPAGADADGGGEECRTTQNAATGEYLLECQGTTVSLGRCGLGFAGSVFLGPDTHSAMESFPSVDRRMNSRNIASFLDNGCSRVLGTVVVTSGATAEHRALLSELEYAESVHFIEPLAGVAMPKLRAAHLYLGEYAELWSSSLAPALTRGGVTISGGERDGPLVLGALQEGVIEVTDVEGLTHLRAPLLRTGSVVASRAPDLEVVDLSALVNSERVFLSELESVEQLSVRALASAGSLELGGLDSLEVLEFPALEVVAGAFELSMIGDVTALTFPELNQIGSALRVSRSEALESMVFSKLSGADGVELRELAELRTVDFATLERVSYFEGFDLPELLEVRAPSLRALDARIGLVDSGYEGEGLSVDLRALERVASLDIDERRLRSLDLSSLTTIDAGDLTIVEGRYLREVIAPVLHEVAVYINVPADGPNVGPLVLDFSSHRFEESITGGMDGAPDYFVHVQNARPLELKMDDAVFTGSMEVDASDLSGIFSVGPGYRGSLVLRNVETGDFVDLTRASGLRFLFLDKVGVPLSPVFGDFSEAVFEELRIFGTALDHLFFGLADGARLEVKDGSATGDLVLTNAPAGELWVEIIGNSVTGVDDQMYFDRVDLSGMTRAHLDILLFHTDVLRLDTLTSVFDDTQIILSVASEVNLSSLMTGVLYLSVHGIEVGGLTLPTGPLPGSLQGILYATWPGIPCPTATFSVWPSFDYITNTQCI